MFIFNENIWYLRKHIYIQWNIFVFNEKCFYSILLLYSPMEVWQRRRYISFFFLIFLFIWANLSFYALMISYQFKSKARFGFCHQLLLKLSRVRAKRNKKAWFRGNSCHFQYFLVFRNFWNWSWYQLEETFLINYQHVRSYATFLLKLWHNIKQIWSMP